MSIRSELLFGFGLLTLGILWLGGNILGVDVWAVCWPAGLILLGIWLLVRPRLDYNGSQVSILLFGDVRRSGSWNVTSQEIYMLIGDVDLDLSQAQIPPGETIVRVISFIGDIDLLVPAQAGVSINSYAFLTTSKFLKRKVDSFVIPLSLQSETYLAAERKIRVEAFGFINDIKIRQVPIN